MALPWDVIPEKAARIIAIEGVPQTVNVVSPTPILIPPNATKAHVRLTYLGLYQGQITSTIFLGIAVKAVTGGFAYTDFKMPAYDAHWRPGDDADLWITIDILKPRATLGATFKVNFGGSGLAGAFAVIFKVATGAVNQLPAQLPYHRPRRTIDLSNATPDNRLDVKTFKASDTGYLADGKTPCWLNRLSFGYSYWSANGQNGLFATPEKFPDLWTDDYGAAPSYSVETDAAGRPFVRLPTRKLKKPYLFSEKSFPFQASVISTLKMKDWCHQTGVWNYWGVLPSQSGVWHSGWLQGVSLKTMSHRWCPEYDQDEEFGGVFNEGPRADLISSTQHVGNHGAGSRARDPVGVGQYLRNDGFAADHDFWTQIHRVTTVIDATWITTYVDGIEYCQARNMLGDESPDPVNDPWALFFKLNVGVKYTVDKPWSGDPKQTDRLLYGYEHYPLNSGYVVSDTLDPMPYPNRQILPGPYSTAPTPVPDSPPDPTPTPTPDPWTIAAWVKGTNTTMTEPTPGLIRVANAGGNPRAACKVSGLTPGLKYATTLIHRAHTGSSVAYRVSATANLTTGDYAGVTKGTTDVDKLVAMTFTAPSSGVVYVGLAVVTTAAGQYGQCDKAITIARV